MAQLIALAAAAAAAAAATTVGMSLSVISAALALMTLLAVLAYHAFRPYLILGKDKDHLHVNAPRVDFDRRRGTTYPSGVPNTWYAICFSEEVVVGATAPMHVRALGQVCGSCVCASI